MTYQIPGQTGQRSYRDAHGKWDELVVESPLIMKAGSWETVNLRTPGHDEDLLRGHLLSEGLVSSNEHIEKITAQPNLEPHQNQKLDEVIAILKHPIIRETKRAYEMRPSCGLCGIENFSDMALIEKKLPLSHQWSSKIIQSLPAQLNEKQNIFSATGACHGAAIFNSKGDLLALAEDVGRHNAVDKAIGHMSTQNINIEGSLLMLSGRCGFELIAKAIRVGIEVVVSVSGTTSLSFELAKSSGTTLVGFCRGEDYRVYHDPGRLEKI